MSYIVIPRWDEFQHRDAARSQVLPWIKSWTRLLSDEAYLNLSFAQRGLLHDLWIEYARARRQVPNNTASVSRRLGHKVSRKSLDALSHAGFIEFSASNPAGIPAGIVAGGDEEKKRKEVYKGTKGQKQRALSVCRTCNIGGGYHLADCPNAKASNGAVPEAGEAVRQPAGRAEPLQADESPATLVEPASETDTEPKLDSAILEASRSIEDSADREFIPHGDQDAPYQNPDYWWKRD